jgi:hypothetical protein
LMFIFLEVSKVEETVSNQLYWIGSPKY